jgi:hypothetical protein
MKRSKYRFNGYCLHCGRYFTTDSILKKYCTCECRWKAYEIRKAKRKPLGKKRMKKK